jgi:hypothetical protein
MAHQIGYKMNIAKFAAIGLVGAVVSLGGCVSYTNNPGSDTTLMSVNHSQSRHVVISGLSRVLSRHGIYNGSEQYAVNFPWGTSYESAQKVIEKLPDGAILPFDGMGDDVPVYSIGRIWIRASDAKVDVIYPAKNFAGKEIEQNVTIWLNGGAFRSWTVNREQAWSPGTIARPSIYIPIAEDHLEMDAEDVERSDVQDGQSGEDQASETMESEPANELPQEDTAGDSNDYIEVEVDPPSQSSP